MNPEKQQCASITHLRCGMTSYHPLDVLNLYCGRCHQFLKAGEYRLDK